MRTKKPTHSTFTFSTKYKKKKRENYNFIKNITPKRIFFVEFNKMYPMNKKKFYCFTSNFFLCIYISSFNSYKIQQYSKKRYYQSFGSQALIAQLHEHTYKLFRIKKGKNIPDKSVITVIEFYESFLKIFKLFCVTSMTIMFDFVRVYNHFSFFLEIKIFSKNETH
ncbi:hypothetical protein RFI_28545 [Reticulomyxa filosa]|uniref:Uncharacterized protein n=1 Tax=Reticulomyxa filosa TaxID=46433 RepID=X6M5U6_RETFI|nr:hypothetical protein RFI_28545 [Reticulomyxa filosa]|eukprot:ETO08842.1 hypothetical protein RFI_28545 [Reticulomyxa filosa]